jgi:hypothetical protein
MTTRWSDLPLELKRDTVAEREPTEGGIERNRAALDEPVSMSCWRSIGLLPIVPSAFPAQYRTARGFFGETIRAAAGIYRHPRRQRSAGGAESFPDGVRVLVDVETAHQRKRQGAVCFKSS